MIADIILATVNHQLPLKLVENSTAALFLDADLSVLGENYYQGYAYGIWKEYEFYGRENYCEGRSAVLTKMLS